MVKKGQWLVLPYKDVKNIPNLWLSPLGVVPQHDRCPRTIADYTFSGVNGDTVPLTDHLPLQFGRALLRILKKIVTSNPHWGPIYVIKIDLADGFYRIHLAPCQIPALGVVFPTAAGRPRLVAFPLALPMGWTSSPPSVLRRHQNNHGPCQRCIHRTPHSATTPPGRCSGGHIRPQLKPPGYHDSIHPVDTATRMG